MTIPFFQQFQIRKKQEKCGKGLVFFMQSSSFLAHRRLRSNAHSLFQVKEIPSDPQIRHLVDPLSSQYFQEDFWFLLDELKEQHCLLFRKMAVKNKIVKGWLPNAGWRSIMGIFRTIL